LTSTPNNNSGIDAVTLEDGRHLLVYNNFRTLPGTPKGPRTPLNVALSADGVNWEDTLVPEDSPISQYSYPSVIQGKDGTIHIVYTWRRQRIKYVRVRR
jgi:alpha-L-rhamnosidase